MARGPFTKSEVVEEVRRLRAAGVSVNDAAKQVGISPSQVARVAPQTLTPIKESILRRLIEKGRIDDLVDLTGDLDVAANKTRRILDDMRRGGLVSYTQTTSRATNKNHHASVFRIEITERGRELLREKAPVAQPKPVPLQVIPDDGRSHNIMERVSPNATAVQYRPPTVRELPGLGVVEHRQQSEVAQELARERALDAVRELERPRQTERARQAAASITPTGEPDVRVGVDRASLANTRAGRVAPGGPVGRIIPVTDEKIRELPTAEAAAVFPDVAPKVYPLLDELRVKAEKHQRARRKASLLEQAAEIDDDMELLERAELAVEATKLLPIEEEYLQYAADHA